MELQDRFIYSTEEFIRGLENSLDKLRVLRYDSKYRILLGEAFCEKILNWENEIRRRKNDPFTIVVAGDFKRGKSAFINALLGEQIVTSDVTTETVTLNHLSYGPESTLAVLSAGKRMRLLADEIKKNKLEALMKQCDEPITKLELKRPCELLKDITIIDTPGMGDALKRFDEMVEQCILQADAVIYIYSVLSPLSNTEQLFLKSAILPQKFTSLFLVGNWGDSLESAEELLDMEAFLEERVKNIFPEGEVYVISSLDELCRELGKTRPNYRTSKLLEERFEKLRKDILNMINEKKSFAVPDRMQRLFQAMINETDQEIGILEQGLTMDEAQVKKAKEELMRNESGLLSELDEYKKKINKLVEGMGVEACDWIMEFLSRMKKEIQNLESVSVEDIQKHLSFYCIDMLREALTQLLDYHRDKLLDEMELISKDIVKKLLSTYERDQKFSFRFELDNRTWTNGDNVGLGVSLLSSMGAFGTIAAMVGSGIAGAMRSREIVDRKPEILKQIAQQVPLMEASALEAVKMSYEKLGKSACNELSIFYESKIEDSKTAVKRYEEVAQKTEEDKGRIRGALEEIKMIFREMSESLSQYKN